MPGTEFFRYQCRICGEPVVAGTCSDCSGWESAANAPSPPSSPLPVPSGPWHEVLTLAFGDGLAAAQGKRRR
jgi:hypothetical protein